MKNSPWRIAIWTAGILVGAFLLLPTLVIVPISFSGSSIASFPPKGWSLQWYELVASSPLWRGALANSLQIAACTTVLSVAIATPVAIVLRNRFTGSGLMLALMMGPLVTPLIVIAIGLFMVFGGLRMNGTFIGLVLAHTMLAIPFVVVTVTAALSSLGGNILPAAEGLGASRWLVMRQITLPLISGGIVAGGIFAFITSWDEAVVALFLTSPNIQTVPSVIWSQVRTELTPAIAAMGTILMIVSVIGMGAAQYLRRNSK